MNMAKKEKLTQPNTPAIAVEPVLGARTVKFADKEYTINEFLNPEEIRYSKSLSCECGYADAIRRDSYNILGYTSTQNGYMGVFECRKCFEKFRHHISTHERYDLEAFKKNLGLKIILQRGK